MDNLEMKYKIAICDDSVADQKYLLNLTQQWAATTQHTIQLNTFPSAENFLFHYAEQKDYDILLLDIEMGDMNGVSLAKKIRQTNGTIQIVFITGFPDFIAEGYEVSALHYLMKPVSVEKLSEVLNKAVTNLDKQETSVIFTVDGESMRVKAGEIIYIEAFAHSCRIHTLHECFDVKMSISNAEKILGTEFVRTHRSYLVGLRYIKRILKSDLVLDTGETVPLSRSNYKTVNQTFIRYFRGEQP